LRHCKQDELGFVFTSTTGLRGRVSKEQGNASFSVSFKGTGPSREAHMDFKMNRGGRRDAFLGRV